MSTIPAAYDEVLKLDQTLADRVKETQAQTFQDHYHLDIKVKLAQEVFADRMRMWVAMRQQSPEIAYAASDDMQKALREFVSLMKEIEGINKQNSLDVHAVYAIFRQIERIIDRELALRGVSQADVTQIKRIINQEVTVPGQAMDEAVEPPSRTAAFMDFTVPKEN